ncbi:uncharacterized protein ARMOST_16840 [Armillaria ostoyae]|uniref:Uncharacterized protein n=1 Tax=Armillaria ostoyae TaxID=47428 RepID=A0A284RXA8_ARMOS|nr:uncharacterized protein ARMOST_16840 [Armillaria ostoyae]
MQITIDFSTHTLIALVATILGITSVLTIFLLYQTYKYEIGRFFRQLFQYAPRFPTPAYFSHSTNSDLIYYEHPGGFYSSEPYNHLATPYVDPHGEFVYPTDAWNTGTGDWDTEPSSYYGGRTLSHRHGDTQSGTLSTEIPLSNLSHVPDVVREDNTSSESTSDRESTTPTPRSSSPSRRRSPSDHLSPRTPTPTSRIT